MEKLTILLPAYNEEKYLQESLNCLVNQTYKDFKCIISDNNSTDKTEQIYKDFIKNNSNFTYIKQTKNIGVVNNTNFLFDRVDTEFCMLFSGHDLIEPTFIEKMIDTLEKNKDVSLAFSRAIGIDENNTMIYSMGIENLYDFTNISPLSRYIKSVKEIRNCTIVQGIFRSKFLKNIRFPKDCDGPDKIFLSHLLWYGKLHIVDEVLYKMRTFKQRAETRQKRIFGEDEISFDMLHNYIKEYLKDFNSLYSGPEEFRVFLNNKIVDILTTRYGIGKLYHSENSIDI